jgi:GNAT superfamily N-acetyltransferase
MNTHLEDLADLNLPQAIRLHSPLQDKARLTETHGVLLHQGAVPIPAPFMNCLMRLEPSVPPDAVLTQAQDFFGGSANPFAVLTQGRHDADLQAHLAAQGFTLQTDLPQMLAEAPVTSPTVDSTWRIELVTQAAQVAEFVRVSAEAYETLGLPAFFTPSFFTHADRLLTPEVSIALASTPDGRGVAAAMVLHTGDVAGVYWVGTVPAARGAGLAAACTAAVTNLALERGALAVTLQASHMGEAIYRQLGYREYARMQRWSR